MQKLMHSWDSVGFLAPSLLSKMFVTFRPKKLSKLILYRRKKKGSSNRERPILDVSLGGPKRASTDLPLPNLGPSEAAPRRHSDYQGSPPRSSIMGCISDAGGMIFPRLSTSSSSCYERLSVEYQGGGGGQVLDLPRLVKLGVFSDESGHLQRQDSVTSMIQQRRSSCSATSFVSSTSSKLKGVYAQQRDFLMRDNQLEQPHIGQLFAGNQFLTHLIAAPPVPAYPPEHAFVEPSPGLLDASLRCRDAELKDRIILFL